MVQVVSRTKTQHRDIRLLMIAHAHLSETPFDTSCSLIEDRSSFAHSEHLTRSRWCPFAPLKTPSDCCFGSFLLCLGCRPLLSGLISLKDLPAFSCNTGMAIFGILQKVWLVLVFSQKVMATFGITVSPTLMSVCPELMSPCPILMSCFKLFPFSFD